MLRPVFSLSFFLPPEINGIIFRHDNIVSARLQKVNDIREKNDALCR